MDKVTFVSIFSFSSFFALFLAVYFLASKAEMKRLSTARPFSLMLDCKQQYHTES